MLLFAVAMNPRGGLNSVGRSDRKPFHSYAPVPGTGNRPTHDRSALVAAVRFGVSADACQAMLPSTSPQIRFSVGAFQYIAAARNSLQFAVCASRRPPRYGAVPGSSSADRSA